MRYERTNRLALLLVVVCCLGSTALAMPSPSQQGLTVVVGCLSTHIVGELEPLDFQYRNCEAVRYCESHSEPALSELQMELQNLPPPMRR
ncbi:MAG: hypothetical protein QGI78_07235 [Phycisphaerales bacterium]|nr:hypothetical protein [Phycisphaerales bacterium]